MSNTRYTSEFKDEAVKQVTSGAIQFQKYQNIKWCQTEKNCTKCGVIILIEWEISKKYKELISMQADYK